MARRPVQQPTHQTPAEPSPEVAQTVPAEVAEPLPNGFKELHDEPPVLVPPPEPQKRPWDVVTRGRVLCRVDAVNSIEAIAEAVRQFKLTRPEKFAFQALPV